MDSSWTEFCLHILEGKVHNLGVNIEGWHFKTVQNPTRLAVSTDISFFAVFRANPSNKNEILAFYSGKYAENIADFGINRSFSLCFNIEIERPKSSYQNCSKFTIAKTWKIVYFGGGLKRTPRHFPKLPWFVRV